MLQDFTTNTRTQENNENFGKRKEKTKDFVPANHQTNMMAS